MYVVPPSLSPSGLNSQGPVTVILSSREDSSKPLTTSGTATPTSAATSAADTPQKADPRAAKAARAAEHQARLQAKAKASVGQREELVFMLEDVLGGPDTEETQVKRTGDS
jgi:hypothetical protein